LVPFLRGQGLNNQLWEYRNAAIIARATSRVLCLEPFHRFYLQQRGRKFIPFRELFDVIALKAFVNTSENCAQECGQSIEQHIELTSKSGVNKPKNPFTVAAWRPGSLELFFRSTGFNSIQSTTRINAANLKNSVKFEPLQSIKALLSVHSSEKCISVSGSTPAFPEEYLKWSRALSVNQNIKNAVNDVKNNIFKNKAYIAIHWRFEETKCAGFGRGIGFGRSQVKRQISKNVSFRKNDAKADICFFAGPVPNNSGRQGIWLRLVSEDSIIQWIKQLVTDTGIENIYIATDGLDTALLRNIKDKTRAIMKSDILETLALYTQLEDNDIVSRIEQEICVTSYIFAGTSMSSWTSNVIEERFKDRSSFFIQNKFEIIRRPDPYNKTLYFDIEVCNCEWL